MPLVARAAFVALALLVAGAEDAEECWPDEAHALDVSLLQGRSLLSRRFDESPSSGMLASKRTCRDSGDGFVQCFPDIMLVGTAKGGTTSVSTALKHHPRVDLQRAACEDEVFLGTKKLCDEAKILDRHRAPGALLTMEHWQWATSPRISARRAKESLLLQYDSGYMYFPDVPYNILDLYPNARNIKYIFTVRDPTKRAVSSWKYHMQSSGENRTFATVVRQGLRQRRNLEACYESALRGMNTTAKHVEDLPELSEQRKLIDRCFWNAPGTHDATMQEQHGPVLHNPVKHAHVDYGIYAEQLRRWFRVLGRENCIVVSLEELAANETGVAMQIMNFTGLQAVGPHGYKDLASLRAVVGHNANPGGNVYVSEEPPEPKKALLDRLDRFYRPYNEELFELIGRKLY